MINAYSENLLITLLIKSQVSKRQGGDGFPMETPEGRSKPGKVGMGLVLSGWIYRIKSVRKVDVY
jgi:hypothetical protein